MAQGGPARIGLADNLADVVLALGGAAGTPKAEMLRVLRPGGKAIVAAEEWTKPFPEGVDDWTHHYHGPDNNPQSLDRLARAPYLTQFMAEPRYAPAPQAAVASAGRLFMAFGHVAWHQREEALMNTLVALNAFNGTMLWKRPLTPGIMVDRSTMIATPDDPLPGRRQVVQAAGRRPRGKLQRRDRRAGGADRRHVLEMDGPGGRRALRPGRRRRSRPTPTPAGGATTTAGRGTRISKGYNDAELPLGLRQDAAGHRPEDQEGPLDHQEDPPIDSRSLCMTGGRIYFCSFGRYLACLDAKTGQQTLAADRREGPRGVPGDRPLPARATATSAAGRARSI